MIALHDYSTGSAFELRQEGVELVVIARDPRGIERARVRLESQQVYMLLQSLLPLEQRIALAEQLRRREAIGLGPL